MLIEPNYLELQMMPVVVGKESCLRKERSKLMGNKIRLSIQNMVVLALGTEMSE